MSLTLYPNPAGDWPHTLQSAYEDHKFVLNLESHSYENNEVSMCTGCLCDHFLWECVVATNWLFANKPCPDSTQHVRVSEAVGSSNKAPP